MTGPASGGATAAVSVNVIALWLAGLFGVPAASIQELLWGMVLSVFGAAAWQFINAQKDREAATSKGVKKPDMPKIDFTTLGYAMLGAPLSSGLLIWLIHMAGGVAVSYLSSGLFIAAGAAGPQFAVAALAFAMRFLSGFTGGPKP